MKYLNHKHLFSILTAFFKKEIAALKQKEERKAGSKKRVHRKLVRRSHFLTIIAAWVITVPAVALLSGILFLALNNLI